MFCLWAKALTRLSLALPLFISDQQAWDLGCSSTDQIFSESLFFFGVRGDFCFSSLPIPLQEQLCDTGIRTLLPELRRQLAHVPWNKRFIYFTSYLFNFLVQHSEEFLLAFRDVHAKKTKSSSVRVSMLSPTTSLQWKTLSPQTLRQVFIYCWLFYWNSLSPIEDKCHYSNSYKCVSLESIGSYDLRYTISFHRTHTIYSDVTGRCVPIFFFRYTFVI